MKSFKKIISIFLAVLMLCSAMTAAGVSASAAEDTIYFVNSNKWAAVSAYCYSTVGGENAKWPGEAATVVDAANGVYSYNAGTHDRIIFNDGKKDGAQQTGNLDTAGNYGKYYEPKTEAFYDSAEAALAAAGSAVNYDYYVAGDVGLCGVSWQASSPSNGMTKGADGTYTKTYTNVPAGTYEYKVTDGTWTNSWGGDVGNDHNAAVTVDVDGSTVVISFVPNNNPTSKVIAPEVPETTAAPATSGSDAVKVTVKSHQGLFADVTREYNVGDKFTVAINLDMKGKDPADSMFNVKFNSKALKVVSQKVHPDLKFAITNITEALQNTKNKVNFNITSPTGCGLTTKSTIVTYTVEVLNVPGTNQTMTLDYQILNAVNADPTKDPIKYIDQSEEEGDQVPGVVQPGAKNLFDVSVDVSASTVKETEPSTTAPATTGSKTVKVTVKSYQGLFADVTREYNVGDKFTLAINLDMKGKDPADSMFNVKFNSKALKVVSQKVHPDLKFAITNITEALQNTKNKVNFNITSPTGCGLTTKSTIVTYTVEVLNVPGTNQTMTLDYQILNAVNADPTKDPIKYIDQSEEEGDQVPGVVQPGAKDLFEVSVDVSASTVKETEPSTTAPATTAAPTTEPTESSTTAPSTTKPVEPSTTAPSTTKPVEPSTTAPSTTKPVEPSTTVPSTTKPVEPSTTAPSTTAAPTTEPVTEPETVTYTYYFAPLQSDIDAGYNFVANICNEAGEWFPYAMTATGTTYNGRAVYSTSVTVPVGAKLKVLQFQTYDGTTWKHQIAYETLSPYSFFDRKVIVAESESMGAIHEYIADETQPTTEPSTTAAPTTEPSTTVAPTTEPSTTVAPTTEPVTQPKPTTPVPTQPKPTQPKPTVAAPTKAPSVEKTEKDIKNTNTDKNDVKGSKFAPLKLKATSSKNKVVKLNWSKVKGAKGYIIYGARCGKTMKKMKTLSKSKKSLNLKKLKKGKYYKYMVVAYKNVKGKKVTLSISKIAHVAVKGGKYGNPTKVTVKKNKLTLKKGKKYTIKYSIKKNKKMRNHVKVRFQSTNTKVAKVSSKGKITAKKKGTCYIYVYAQNGIYKKVKIKVK